MAPMKRTRVGVDNNSGELRKRPRTSSNSASVPSDAEEDESNHRGEQADAATMETGPNDEAPEAESGNEDDDTQRATQIIQLRNTRTMDNMPADNGILESVTCINFMCHSRLHVAFGPLINFIIGHNGSGKSAVLTAVTLCLGGKATSTNRGQSLKSFIKEGQESATLSVKVKNQGHTAYQQELYGDSIVVERSFSRAGASNFRLKSASGRTISTKKADLEEICDFFALQLDNPMNVLTQDMARQFLSNSTAAEKYKFFVKGVQLEQLDQDYQLLEETIDQIESKIITRAEDIKVLEDRASRAAARLALSDKQDSMRTRIRSYTRQMAWAQVEEQEKELDVRNESLQKADARIGEATAKAGTVDQKFEEANHAWERAQEASKQVIDSKAPLELSRSQVKERFDKNKEDLLAVQTDHRSIRGHLTAIIERIEKANIEIEQENTRLEEANGGSHARRVRALEEAREQAAKVKDEFDQHRQALPQMEGDLRAAQAEARHFDNPIGSKKNEIRQCEDAGRSLLRNQGQHIGAFHERMPMLLRAIQEEARFQEKPVGPVGNHVRLLKPDWSSILERAFGATLNSFIVTSVKDQTVLSDLMRRVNCPCPILIGNHQSIDTSKFEPDPALDTTMRVLEIDNDLVKHQLIINQSIEQTVLIRDWAEATRFMYDGAKPQHVKQCFCLHKDRRGWGMRLGFGRGVEASSSPMPPNTGRPRMKTDTESQINIQRDNQRHLEGELRELEQRFADARGRVRRCEDDIATHRKRLDDLRQQTQRAQDEVEKQQDELEQETVQDGRLEALTSGLKEAEEEKTILEGSYQEAIISKQKLNETASQLHAELKTFDDELKEISAKARKAEAKVLKLLEARHIALQEKNLAVQRIADAEHDKQREHQERQTQADRVTEFIEEATKICARVPVDPGESTEGLDKKLTKLHENLKRFERQIGATRETIAREAAQTRSAFQTAQSQVRDLESLSQLLKFALFERQERWRKFRRFISARARAQFTYLLSERSFRGSLKTDHNRRQLDLHVEPDETKSGRGRQTKTLSGGEKSFSTICLLLSLWEAMGSPIRCLDEFDVFMDNVNRDVSMRMMITAARRSPGRQYILITPNSMGNIDIAGDVRIIKLNDPERGQTTLLFGQ
ncbi:MAG: Structural maintenance of chromosomes protein 6 [Phylliscum demangeonii]|nr:MAG: Structural maintenance of chromosomes protein 6 [Phylliscum demangeonii]